MDHIEHSVGNEWSFRGDTQYNFDDGSFLKNVKVGARYADRDQKIRNSAYNWGAISEVWSGSAVSFAQSPEHSGFYSFDNFFRGQTSGPPGGYYFNGNLIEAYSGSAEYFKGINDIWHNENGATATNRWMPASQRAGVIPGTDFLPQDIQNVGDSNLNAYFMLIFGHYEYADSGLKQSCTKGERST